MYNSVISTRNTRLYRFQPSSVVLCMQNSAFWTGITSLCGSKTPPVVFSIKTATSGPESQVSMGPRLYRFHPSSVVLCIQKSDLMTTIACVNGAQTSPVIFGASKTECLASEILISMGPSPHLWFLHVNQRLFEQKCMSLWVPELTCDYLHAKQRA